MKRVRERQREDEGEAGISGRRLLKQNTVAACLSPGQIPFAVFADQITRFRGVNRQRKTVLPQNPLSLVLHSLVVLNRERERKLTAKKLGSFTSTPADVRLLGAGMKLLHTSWAVVCLRCVGAGSPGSTKESARQHADGRERGRKDYQKA